MGSISQATPAERRRKSLGRSPERLPALKIARQVSLYGAIIRPSSEYGRSDDPGGVVDPARRLSRNGGEWHAALSRPSFPPPGLLGSQSFTLVRISLRRLAAP